MLLGFIDRWYFIEEEICARFLFSERLQKKEKTRNEGRRPTYFREGRGSEWLKFGNEKIFI